MSGMYVRRGSPSGFGELGWNVSELPIISGALSFADRKLRDAVEAIAKRYAQYVQVQQNAPATLSDAQRVVAVMQESGSPEQRAQAARYLAAAQEAQKAAANSGPVEQVVRWLESLKSTLGLGVLPAIPLWLAGTAVVALAIVNSAIGSWNESRTIRAALAAGFTPEQIAKIGAGRVSFPEGVAKATNALTALLVVGGALYLWNVSRSRRS